MLQAEKISKIYRSAAGCVTALAELSLQFNDGETIAIIGPSGSGKSTLLNLLAGLDRPSQGAIIHNQQDLTEMAEKRLADYRLKNFGFIFQNYNLVSILTASENVELPLSLLGWPAGKRRLRAQELLKEVGLANRFDHRPHQLSGGEQQRVAIARALVAEPNVIFADEPTGNLDSKTGQQILDLLTKTGQRTLILVTHDGEVAKLADRIVQVRDGRLVTNS